HFAYEARYNGAKLCVISPDYNSSAIHADHFLQIQPGTDGLLAMGVARILIEKGWINRPYITEQTDLPLLVRTDNGRFLRESDLIDKGDPDIFYFHDRKTGKPVQAPGCQGLRKRADGKPTSIRLDGFDAALQGRFTVTLANGKQVEVLTVFEKLKK